jgi:outer membrane protein assembly factor BamB
VIALDAKTGKLLWHSVEDEAGYSSPISYGDPDKPRLLCWMRNDLWSLDAATGKVRHHKRLRSSMDASVNAATPIPIGEGDYFISAGYGVGGSLWTLEPEDDPFEPTELGGDFESHYSTPVVHDWHLYGFHDRQETGQTLRCVDLNEGKVKWNSPRVPGGHVILVGDKVVCVTEQGELWIVKATPGKFEQLHVSQILRAGHRSPPAFAGGVLYARDGRKLVAVRLR